MIERLIAWSIRRRELIALGAVFVLVAGVLLLRTMPVDAIPDLSDTQVIVYTDYPGQAPPVVEDQITYPLLTTFLAVPKVKVVRGQSMFSSSFVYVIFQDGTDLYWARSRVLEYLNAIQSRDRKSTRLNSSHVAISYAVFCLKKKILQAPRTT